MNTSPNLKPLAWIGSSKADLMRLPRQVVRKFGLALHAAQLGETHPHCKRLKGLGSGVLEVVEDFEGSAYRAVYTIRFEQAVFVLHVFQKKAKHGIATPKPDIDLITRRLKKAQETVEEMR